MPAIYSKQFAERRKKKSPKSRNESCLINCEYVERIEIIKISCTNPSFHDDETIFGGSWMKEIYNN